MMRAGLTEIGFWRAEARVAARTVVRIAAVWAVGVTLTIPAGCRGGPSNADEGAAEQAGVGHATNGGDQVPDSPNGDGLGQAGPRDSTATTAAADSQPTNGPGQAHPAFEVVGPAADDATFVGLSAAELEPLMPGSQRWTVVQGDGVGTSFVRTVAASDRFGAQVADRWGDLHTHFLRRENQQVLMPANTSHEDKAITIFDPPLVVAPARLTAAAPFVSRARMRVVDEQDPSKVMHLGRCERTLTLQGRDVVRTPLGELVAVRVRMEFQATLQLAKASEVATLYVVPGLGVIAEDRVERINALGFVNRTRRSVVVRSDRPAALGVEGSEASAPPS